MSDLKLSREDYAALQAAIDNPPVPNDALIALMRAAYAEAVEEPVPQRLTELLDQLNGD